jgi:hypothetical protein
MHKSADRHSIAFARAGLDVTANDLSPFLLDQTRELATAEGLDSEFNRQDMRTIHVDLVAQLFSSFGYFDSDDEERTLSERHVTKKITLKEENGNEHSFSESVQL